MATDTADAPRTPAAPDPTRHVWQIPAFVLGVAVFVSAWQGWLPLGTPDPAAEFARDLDALRLAYDKVTPDRDEVREFLARVAAGIDSFPESGPFARYVLGSGYARLAELTPAPEEARSYWTLARQHFELVRPEQLRDPADGPKLAFRAAKARAAVGVPPNTPAAEIKLLMAVLSNAPVNEDPGEAGRLQADLAMRLTPPDMNTAREALTRYLTTTGIATPAASLARAKLELAEIHTRRGEHELARKWLEQVGADAPPNVLVPARAQLALVRMVEEDWVNAARDWEAVRAAPGLSQSLRTQAAFHLAVCRDKTRDVVGAIALFDEAAKGDGPEARAAAVRLADLYLKGPEPAKRLLVPDLLANAVKGITGPRAVDAYDNPHLRPAELTGVFEQAVSVLLRDEAFESAVKVAETYSTISASGREREKKAEALAAWATSLQKAGREFRSKAEAAAAEYEALAGFQPAATAKADMYRRAAGMYKLAGEPAKGVAALQAAVKLPQLPDAVAGAAWADLADLLIATNRKSEAFKAFSEAMATVGPVSTATRFRLARQFLETRHEALVPIGLGLLKQVAGMEVVSPAEKEYHEQALVGLGYEVMRGGNYAEAETWLRKQLGLYPTGPEASLGRLFLGICLLQRAGPPAHGAPADAARTKLREDAIVMFRQVVAEADAKHKRDGRLGDRDAWLRLQAGLRILQTYQQMEKPDQLLAEAQPLLDRHRKTIEELIILSLMYHAYKQKNEPGLALGTRDKMKEVFDGLPVTAFTATSGEYSRAYWEKVWFAPDPK